MEDQTNEEVKTISAYEQLSIIVGNSLDEVHNSFRQTRGIYFPEEEIKRDDNLKVLYRVRGLNALISSLQQLIIISKPNIPNDSDDNKTLQDFLTGLRNCHHAIRIAERTKDKSDDFMIFRKNYNGEEVAELTDNFFDMIEELEELFEKLFRILIKHGIISKIIKEIPKRRKLNEF